ncbi:MAG: MoaD/ThiS family protein [Woeseiaceae bacterium]|jgi:molybdopterin converting factor small subunit|nr:MoaD/ThiS family protein [Woeseiaceae bacterium]
MSKITVRIPMPLRPFVDDATVMDADADTVGAALEQIGARHPGFLQRVIVNDGELRPYVNVFVGVDDVRSHSGLKMPLRDGDVVSIISAVAGG